MSTRDDGQRIHYRSHRRSRAKEPRVTFKGTYWATSEPTQAKSGSIEHFLTERYCLYSKAPDGTLLRTNVHHPPWPLQAAAAEIEENTVGAAQGIDLHGSPALLHFSRCLDVVVWSPVQITMADPGERHMLFPRL